MLEFENKLRITTISRFKSVIKHVCALSDWLDMDFDKIFSFRYLCFNLNGVRILVLSKSLGKWDCFECIKLSIKHEGRHIEGCRFAFLYLRK